MKTTSNFDYSKYDNVNVCFHIGRGGRFRNPGHKTFVPGVTSLSQCFADEYKYTIIDTDDDGNPLPDDEWKLVAAGDAVLTGRDEIESETGVLDWDGEYDTDIVKPISDCTQEELELIYNTSCTETVDGDTLDYVCEALELVRVHNIHVFGSNMALFCQDGVRNLLREVFEVYTEDEIAKVRDALSEYYFTEASIDMIVDKMLTEEWLTEGKDM